jgi:hypothetical protein
MKENLTSIKDIKFDNVAIKSDLELMKKMFTLQFKRECEENRQMLKELIMDMRNVNTREESYAK